MHSKDARELPDTSKGYEQTDLESRPIIIGVAIYFAFAIGVAIVVMIFFIAKGQYGAPNENAAPKLALPLEPNPLLQNNITARTDIWNLRAFEDKMLHSSTWVDQSKGIVRIPIEQAVDLAASAGPAGNATQPFQPAVSVTPPSASKTSTPSGLAVTSQAPKAPPSGAISNQTGGQVRG